jgi:hypothetical protein
MSNIYKERETMQYSGGYTKARIPSECLPLNGVSYCRLTVYNFKGSVTEELGKAIA